VIAVRRDYSVRGGWEYRQADGPHSASAIGHSEDAWHTIWHQPTLPYTCQTWRRGVPRVSAVSGDPYDGCQSPVTRPAGRLCNPRRANNHDGDDDDDDDGHNDDISPYRQFNRTSGSGGGDLSM
jgi:hypothetical protein